MKDWIFQVFQIYLFQMSNLTGSNVAAAPSSNGAPLPQPPYVAPPPQNAVAPPPPVASPPPRAGDKKAVSYLVE